MEPIQIISLVIFLITIGMIIWGKVDRAVIGIIGVVLMVLFGVMNETEAFMFVDWNVIAILFSIWVIAGYFGKTGIPQFRSLGVQPGVIIHPDKIRMGFRQYCETV